MSVVGPVTKAPPRDTPRAVVAELPGSTFTRPRLISKLDSTGRKVLSAAWLTAGMTVWAGITNSEPGMGTGERAWGGRRTPAAPLRARSRPALPRPRRVRTGCGDRRW